MARLRMVGMNNKRRFSNNRSRILSQQSNLHYYITFYINSGIISNNIKGSMITSRRLRLHRNFN